MRRGNCIPEKSIRDGLSKYCSMVRKSLWGFHAIAKDGSPNSKTLKAIRDQVSRELGLEDRWLPCDRPARTTKAGLGITA